MASELQAVGKAFTDVGIVDPRLNIHGKIDPGVAGLVKGMSNQDPPPERVKPCPIQVLQHAQKVIQRYPTTHDQATMDMAWIGLFYILRPGEYTKNDRNQPLAGKHVALAIGLVLYIPALVWWARVQVQP